MITQHGTCIIFVDYEDLLTALPYCQPADIDDLLMNLLREARQQYLVQVAIAFGDWSRLASRRSLESIGYLCKTPRQPPGAAEEIQWGVIARLDHPADIETYLIIGGQSSRTETLRRVREAGRRAVLWQLTIPSPSDQALCASWRRVVPRNTSLSRVWPRRVMLDGLALAAVDLDTRSGRHFLVRHLVEQLEQLPAYADATDVWLSIAIREQVVLLQTARDAFDLPYGQVNRQHPVVERALLLRDRTIATIDAMLAGRKWVAFGSVERALLPLKQLADSQRVRQAWLELLVTLKVLLSEQRQQPNGHFQTTMLALNRDHPAVPEARRQQHTQVARLIVTIDHFLARRSYEWIAASSLLKLLTNGASRVEARAMLRTAEELGVVRIGSLPSPRYADAKVTTVQLDRRHRLVADVLAQRDQIIVALDQALTARQRRASAGVLIEDLASMLPLDAVEVVAWMQLLQYENVCLPPTAADRRRGVTPLLRLNLRDPVVSRALRQPMKSPEVS